jgi:hypothetical protein
MRLGSGSGLLLGAATLAAGCHSQSLDTQNGRCGPTPHLLASAAVFPAPDAASERALLAGMAVGGSDLFFAVGATWADPRNLVAVPASAGALMQVSTFGSTPKQLATGYDFGWTPLVMPTAVIVGVTSASSIADPGILSVPRNGDPAVPLVALTYDSLLTLPVTDGTSVYFTANAGVESVPLAPGASPAVPTQLSSEYPIGLGVFGQRLLLLLSSGQVEGIPIGASDAGTGSRDAGTGEASLGAGFADPVPDSLIPCGADACWMAGGAIEQMDPAEGEVTALASLAGGPVAAPSTLLYDGTNFFVLGSSGSYAANAAIARVPAKGGAPVVVATLPPSSRGLAVDDACVYFGTSTGIFSLLKDAEGVVVP